MFSSKQWTYLIGLVIQLSLLIPGCHGQSSTSATNIGVIIGAAVGGVILLVLLIILFMMLCSGPRSDDIRFFDDRSSRSSCSSRHSHHYKRPPPPRPVVPPGVWTTMPYNYGIKSSTIPRPPPPVIIPVKVPPRPVAAPHAREHILQRTVRRAKTMVKNIPAIFQARRFKPYVPPQVYESAHKLPMTAGQQELERKMRVGEDKEQNLAELRVDINRTSNPTAHVEVDYYENGDGQVAKAYSDYSLHCDEPTAVLRTNTGENVARAYSSYSVDVKGYTAQRYNTYDDINTRARSDLGLARSSQIPTYNPYGSGVVMRPKQPTVTNSSPQMLFNREDGMPVDATAGVHKREPRRVASANDPNALYAQPDKITRTSAIPEAPPPPPPNVQTTKSRDGFATTGMKVTADTFKFLEEYEDVMEFGAEE